MATRGKTAYFIFSEQHRAAVYSELQVAAGGEGAKVPVTVVAKAIGQKWKALTDEEKERYKTLAQEAAAAAAEARNNRGEASPGEGPAGDDEQQDGEADAGNGLPPFGFPLGSIKKIMLLDRDVSRISADAVRASAKATELFVHLLAVKAHGIAKRAKRRTLKLSDIEFLAKSDRRLVDMGLRQVLHSTASLQPQQTENAAGQTEKQQGGEGGKKDSGKGDARSKLITSFFQT